MQKSRLVLMLTIASLAIASTLRADESPWPPTLPGVENGRIALGGPSLLEVPEAVKEDAAKPGSAPFTLAKTPAEVELHFHQDLGPNASSRRLWSSWGDIGLARDGRVYCGIGDHANDVGGDANCFVYCFDPSSNRLEKIVDMNEVIPPNPAPKVKKGEEPIPGQPAWSKIHAKIDEGNDGKIYFSCTLNDGNRAKLPSHGFNDVLPGGQLYQYDPATGKVKVFANLPPRRCTATSLMDRKRNLWWCNLEAGEGNALFALDMKTGKPAVQLPDGTVGFNREFALAADGSIFFNGENSLMKYDASSGKVVETGVAFEDSPGMRSASRETKDGAIYGASQKNNQIFRYSVKDNSLTMLGPTWGGGGNAGGGYTTVVDLSPDEKYLYYLPGAHGGAFKHGTPVVQYEIATGNRKVLAFLAPTSESKHHYAPSGTYGVKLSADGSTLYANLNGHATQEHLPPHLKKPNGFGLCSFAVIHIPNSER